MKLAVIDCGTNTFNLILVNVHEDGRYEKYYHTRVPVKLGEGTINGGYIDSMPFERGVEAISGFRERIDREGVDKVLAFATSAIRDGSNGRNFVETISNKFGIELEVIDGNREADLVYSAVREAVQLGDHVSLIMDIGGGSTEFILADKGQIFWKQSFMIGAARLLEKFRPGDPISPEEIKQFRAYLQDELTPLFEAARKYKPVELVGSSGAFESFIEMINSEFGGEPFDPEKTAYTIDIDMYRRISRQVVASTMEQRKKIKGLIPMRYDMIVICCLMVDFVLEKFQLDAMRMSAWSLKEGAMMDFIKSNVA